MKLPEGWLAALVLLGVAASEVAILLGWCGCPWWTPLAGLGVLALLVGGAVLGIPFLLEPEDVEGPGTWLG